MIQMEVRHQHQVDDLIDMFSLFYVIEVGQSLHISIDHVHTNIKHDLLVTEAHYHARSTDVLTGAEGFNLNKFGIFNSLHYNIISEVLSRMYKY
jgi:hypothetical protein